jgi:hypothetical protein
VGSRSLQWLPCWLPAHPSAIHRVAHRQHGGDQIQQWPAHVVFGGQHYRAVIQGSRGRWGHRELGGTMAGPPGPGRRVPPTGGHRCSGQCPTCDAAWCRPARSGSPRPSPAHSVPALGKGPAKTRSQRYRAKIRPPQRGLGPSCIQPTYRAPFVPKPSPGAERHVTLLTQPPQMW